MQNVEMGWFEVVGVVRVTQGHWK